MNSGRKQHSTWQSLFKILIVAVLWSLSVSAGEIVKTNFNFESISAVNKNSDAKWFTRWQTKPELKLENEGNENYLRITSDASLRPVILAFPALKLPAEIGSALTLEFDLRIQSEKANPGELFLFGLYYSNKTTVKKNGSPLSDNDYGYLAGLRRTHGKPTIRKEAGGDSIVFSGKDIQLINDGDVNFKLSRSNEFNKIRYVIRRTSAGVHISLYVNNKELAVASVLKDPYVDFNEIIFSSTRSATVYDIKNICLKDQKAD